MSSLNYSPPVIKEEAEVCWTEKEVLGLNIVVKEEKDAVFGVKKEGEITVTLKDEEVEIRDLSNTTVKKNTHRQGTGGGSPKADLTPAEDMALELNKGRPVLEGIPGGKETSIGSSQDATRFIQVSGSTVFLLEPPAQAPDDADPGEGPSAAATAHDGDDDDEEETISLDSRRHESSQAIRKLYGNHLRRQIELADIDIQYKKKKMENLALESEIKKRTIRKLDLEKKKLEREVRYAFNVHCMLTVTQMY
uniref:uncharacterized protein LOC123994988 isoform X3 n=1 Tax=Oncorhynchus gorbuscha TaxID=8017 RepID=UPI001EAE9EA4|nr:uncharacterized protein LOC123994988 isoform X3 [Oncorhynchus gorbuscha]